MKNILFIVFFASLVQGCSTSYQPKSFSGGFSETQLDENVFNVTFSGNGFTSREQASDFTLLRSAELTLKNGYKYFVIVTADKKTSVGTYTSPTTYNTTANAYGTGSSVYGNATTTSSGGETYNFAKPSESNTIMCFKEKPESGMSYNADYIYKNITQKYGIRSTL
jgi:hypothetical protein